MRFNQQTTENRRIRPASCAFTLAEVLAAIAFMAIVIPVALEGLSIASRAGEVAVRRSEAALVAERILNENVVTTNWDRSVQSGMVRQGFHDFRWTMRNEPWNEDPNSNWMRLLSVEVAYNLRGIEHQLRLNTLVDSATPFAQTNAFQ